jgi:hypothetical protein
MGYLGPRGTFTPWQYLPPFNHGQPGNANTVGGGGGMGPFFRDALDARRSMYNQTPEAQYPDGYLGTINSRRGDRLLDSLKNRQNQRSYVRGVHKGERIDPSDYFFPPELPADGGLQREAMGVQVDTLVLSPRNAPQIQYLPMYRQAEDASPAYQADRGDRRRQALWGAEPGIGRTTQLRKLAPPWR